MGAVGGGAIPAGLGARFHHVGILVPDLEAVSWIFGSVLGAVVGEVQSEPELGMDVRWVRVGETSLEFLAPRSVDSRVAELLNKGSGGVHHVALAVDHIEAALAYVRRSGLALIDQVPRPGTGGARIAFLNPEDTAGVLVELVEERSASAPADLSGASAPAAT